MKSIFLSENIRFNATLRNVSVDMLSSYRIVEPPAIFVPLALRVPYPRQGGVTDISHHYKLPSMRFL